MRKVSLLISIVLFVGVLGQYKTTEATGEQCIYQSPSGINMTWYNTFTNGDVGSVLYNRQIAGTNLRNNGGLWWLIKPINTTQIPFTYSQSEVVINYYSTSSPPSFVTIFNTYGSGEYIFFSNDGMNSIQGCPGTNDTSQSSGYARFIIDSLGNYTYSAYGLGYVASSTPTVPIIKNIEILNPTYGTTTATTTFSVQIKYKTPFSLDFRPTTTRHFEIVDAISGELDYSYNVILPANSGENILVTATTSVPEGSKYIRAMYLDQQGGVYSEIDEVFFNVATNTYYAATGLLTPRDNPSDLTQINCGTFEFGCQIQKAITFLFVPSQDVLNKFTNLWQSIAEKKPFGYVTLTINQLDTLQGSTSSAFTLGTVPFMDSLFTPFRTAIATILWALFAIYFYQNRLRHLDI